MQSYMTSRRTMLPVMVTAVVAVLCVVYLSSPHPGATRHMSPHKSYVGKAEENNSNMMESVKTSTTGEQPSAPARKKLSARWRSCGRRLMLKVIEMAEEERSFEKLMTKVPSTSDVAFHIVQDGSVKRLDGVKMMMKETEMDKDLHDQWKMFGKIAHGTHKVLESGSHVILLYPDNTVVSVDSGKCLVSSIHLSFGDNELHPEIREEVTGGNALKLQADGKGKKKRPTPRPTVPPAKPRPKAFLGPLCVNGRGGFASLRVPASGRIMGLTLAYRSGQMYHCGKQRKSCYGKFGGGCGEMAIIVTRNNPRQIMYPARGTPGFKKMNKEGFYHLARHNQHSESLTFGGPSYNVRKGEILRFYYSEAYTKKSLKDNGGRTCFYVLLFYTNSDGGHVCVGGRGGYGTMKARKTGTVTGLELTHLWGEIYHCGPPNRKCYGKMGGADDKMAIIVTNTARQRLYPQRGTGGFVGGVNSFGYYRLLGYGRYSNKISLIGPNRRARRGETVRFYYAESYTKKTMHDNGGVSCFRVRAHYHGENQHILRQNNVLARRFAPWLYFSSGAKDFPMNAQSYLNFKTKNRNPKKYVENRHMSRTMTYYIVARCGRQIRIIYYWYYGYQQACVNIKLIKLKKGHHRGDWEKTMVTLKWNQRQIAAVSYEQHSGQLTKMASGVRWRNHRPIIYVGNIAHGSYPDDKIRSYHKTHKCQYFGDHRRPSSRTKWDSRRRLLQITPYQSGGQTWMKNMGFCKAGYQCEVGTRPQELVIFAGETGKKYCNYRACDATGCEESECLSGWYRYQIPLLGLQPRCCKKCGWWKFKYPCKCRKRNFVLPHHDFK